MLLLEKMEVKELWLLQNRPNPMILIISCPHTFPTFPHVVPSLSYMTTAAPTLTHHTLTHSSAPVHSLRMPPKRSSDRKKEKEKKTEKEGKGRLWWPQREGGREGGTPPSSKPLHEASKTRKTLSLAHTCEGYFGRRTWRCSDIRLWEDCN